MLCILYVIAVGTCLGIAALLVERALPQSWARRWVWCAVIPVSVVLPGYYRAHHNWSITAMLNQRAAAAAPDHVLGMPLSSVLDSAWWTRIEGYDAIINRLWLSASAVLLAWGLVTAWRVARVMRRARRERGDPGRPTTVDGVAVIVTDAMGPATVGLWRTRVLVPHWVLALPRIQRRYVLHHEEEHRTAHDARLLFVASLTLILMPWNLALWWQLRRLRLAVEMDCDNRVVAALGDATAYGTLLLTVAQASSRGPRLQPALLGGVGMLEHRLTMLLSPTPLRHIQRFLLPAMALGLLLVVLSMPHPVLGARGTTHGTTAPGATSHAHAAHAPEGVAPRR